MTIQKTPLLILLVLYFCVAHAQKMYKWTDENGTIHYSKKPPEQINGEEFSLNKKRVGDKQCCGLVRNIVSTMINTNINNEHYASKYASLFESEDFNVNELNNFVHSRIQNRTQRYSIGEQAYSQCMNAGFKFCRSPIELDSNNTKKGQSLSGSGFIVSESGHILTNEHVAGGCKKIEVHPLKLEAQLIDKDAKNDLALLKIEGSFKDFASFSVNTAILGEQVIAAGFPYKELLSSGIKISTGNISSLAGIQNDKKVVQISTPIQPGNSGGPLIDYYGNVVGVIVSKLNSKIMYKYMDDLPQNVNFAIKAKYAKEFLRKNSIQFNQKASITKYDIPTISKAAEIYTVEINCIN